MSKYLSIALIMILTVSCDINQRDRSFSAYNIEKNNIISVNRESVVSDSLNWKYKISDSIILLTEIKKLKKVKELLDQNYNGTSIKNDLVIFGLPTEKDPNWDIELCQFQPMLAKYTMLIMFKINTITGETTVFDWNLNTDHELSLKEWEKENNKINCR